MKLRLFAIVQILASFSLFAQDFHPVTTQASSTRICRDSTVWSIGFNHAGHFGNGSDGPTPPPSKAILPGRAVCVVADEGSSLATVLRDGSVYIWGSWGIGSIGIADLPTIIYEPMHLPFVENVSRLALGFQHVSFLHKDSTLSASGSNGRGQLGQDHADPIESGAVSVGLTGVVTAEAGVDVSLALTSDGTLYGWGYNGAHTISASETELYLSPTPVHPELGPWESFSLASGFSSIGIVIAVNEAGEVYVWGGDAFYVGLDNQLGNIVDPIELEQFHGVTKAVSNAANHCLVLTNSGQVYAAGVNSFGELGQGHSNRITGFHLVEGLSDIVDIHADYRSSFALGSDQSVWCWGSNSSSRLVMERDDLTLTVPTLLPEYCSTVSVREGTAIPVEDREIIATHGELEIVLDIPLTAGSAQLFDVNGSSIDATIELEGQSVHADLRHLSTGLYFLVVRQADGLQRAFRLLVNH